MRGDAAAHSASALARRTLLMKLPPAKAPATPLLKPTITKSQQDFVKKRKNCHTQIGDALFVIHSIYISNVMFDFSKCP